MVKQPKVFHLIQRAHAALFRAADGYLKRRLAVSSSQLAVLLFLHRHQCASLTHLADQLSVRYSGMSGLIDRMVKADLVVRQTAAKDKRVTEIRITPSGTALAAEAMAEVKQINARLLAPFTEREQEVIGRFLVSVAGSADDLFIESQRASEPRMNSPQNP